MNVLVKDVEELKRRECASSSSLVAVGLARSSLAALGPPLSRSRLGKEVDCIAHTAKMVGLSRDSVSLVLFEPACREGGETNLAVVVTDIGGCRLAESRTARRPVAGATAKRIHSGPAYMECPARWPL